MRGVKVDSSLPSHKKTNELDMWYCSEITAVALIHAEMSACVDNPSMLSEHVRLFACARVCDDPSIKAVDSNQVLNVKRNFVNPPPFYSPSSSSATTNTIPTFRQTQTQPQTKQMTEIQPSNERVHPQQNQQNQIQQSPNRVILQQNNGVAKPSVLRLVT
jgi:hypothetical protein